MKHKKYEMPTMPSPRFGEGPNAMALTIEAAKRKIAWLKRNNIVRIPDCSAVWTQLMPGRIRKYIYYGDLTREGWFDHMSIWNTGEGSRIFVSQPYADEQFLQPVYAWAEERGMAAMISDKDSWWYPGQTMLVELRVSDPYEYLEYIRTHLIEGNTKGVYFFKKEPKAAPFNPDDYKLIGRATK